MRKQMMENVALEVATQVRAVEESIETALAELAELQVRMINARAATRAGTTRATGRVSRVRDERPSGARVTAAAPAARRAFRAGRPQSMPARRREGGVCARFGQKALGRVA